MMTCKFKKRWSNTNTLLLLKENQEIPVQKDKNNVLGSFAELVMGSTGTEENQI